MVITRTRKPASASGDMLVKEVGVEICSSSALETDPDKTEPAECSRCSDKKNTVHTAEGELNLLNMTESNKSELAFFLLCCFGFCFIFLRQGFSV